MSNNPYSSNEKIIVLKVENDLPNIKCQNCNDAGTLFLFRITAGPFSYNTGQKGCRQFDDDLHRGYYEGVQTSIPCPECREEKFNDFLLLACGLKKSDKKYILDKFLTSGVFSIKSEAKESILHAIKKKHGLYTLYGGYGVGKSHLLKAAVFDLAACGLQSYYITSADMLSKIRNNFNDPNGSEKAENDIQNFVNFDVLAIDEIDRINFTNWSKETLFRILNERYERIDNCLTLIASNKSPDKYPSDLGYLVSRIYGGVVVFVKGPDVRPALSSM